MNGDPRIQDGNEHREICSLMPWYLNGRLEEVGRQRVDAHVQICSTCRLELQQERQIYQQMSSDGGIEYLSGPSLKRLHAKLDEPESRAALSDAPQAATLSRTRTLPWWALLAASLAAVAVALSVSTGNRWLPLHAALSPSSYYTVTKPAARSPDEVVRAVFFPTITLTELETVLAESQLRIISGPTDAGVYSLAATSNRPVDASLAVLRRHASVRFAESTRAVGEPR